MSLSEPGWTWFKLWKLCFTLQICETASSALICVCPCFGTIQEKVLWQWQKSKQARPMWQTHVISLFPLCLLSSHWLRQASWPRSLSKEWKVYSHSLRKSRWHIQHFSVFIEDLWGKGWHVWGKKAIRPMCLKYRDRRRKWQDMTAEREARDLLKIMRATVRNLF